MGTLSFKTFTTLTSYKLVKQSSIPHPIPQRKTKAEAAFLAAGLLESFELVAVDAISPSTF